MNTNPLLDVGGVLWARHWWVVDDRHWWLADDRRCSVIDVRLFLVIVGSRTSSLSSVC